MILTAEQILENWNKLINYINTEISSPRKEALLAFYNKFEDRLVTYPASNHKKYHNCFPGGYVDHVLRVIECAIKVADLWEEMGSDNSTFTREELIFSAMNHDLGKMGDEKYEAYLPQTDAWRKEKLGEDYSFNTNLPFASVPDRGLFLLQQNDIKYTFNEMLAIQTHDGLYDDANEKYYKSWGPETKFRTNLPNILHQADYMAAKIEFDKDWANSFNTETKPEIKSEIKIQNGTTKKESTKKDSKYSNLINKI